MKRLVLALLSIPIFSIATAQADIEARNRVEAGYYTTNGIWSGAILHMNSPTSDNWIRFEQNVIGERGRIGFSGEGGLGNLMIKNSNTGFSDLIILRGGNGGQFWMYPDGKLYANNIGDIGSNRDMHWNQTTGEIGWTSSSRRFKTNIRTMEDDWMKILQVNPVTYTRPDSPDQWEIGYIAEELDSIGLKSLVGYGDDGLPEYIDYEKIVVYLVEMVKLQQLSIYKQDAIILSLQESVVRGRFRKKIGNKKTL